ncbi:hypothetical protein [Marilutibacter aestuarii]|uniref:TonB-dependent receptor n=1 Tax=Marilutibacter aestuarii TaxID=1706195 RepID=A0A508A4Y0_9GAMM|nr:hypothetical protein [Lysobacter aestuarii]TQD44397.1 hypothetical protein FKV25_09755 [Lysobacter aestuarii]
MTLRRKLLDAALLGVLAGLASTAAAQSTRGVAAADAQPPVDEGAPPRSSVPSRDDPASTAPPPDCTDEGCSSEEGILLRIRTRSEDQPTTTPDTPPTSRALAPDRRVTIERENPGTAVALGRFSVALPDGGVIWATEDPNPGLPELSISATSMLPFDGQRVTRPVRFYARGNYSAFVERYEVSIYRASDADLIEPIATVPLEVAAVAEGEWDGTLPDRYRFRTGDELLYVLRAHGADGTYDETFPQAMQLVLPEEAESGNQRLRMATERSLGMALTADQAETRRLLDNVFAGSGLRLQNIPLNGSRVRIQGRNLPERATLAIDGDSYPVDLDRKFVAEYLMPVGSHDFEVALSGPEGDYAHTLAVDVSGDYFFGVGIADVTIARNDVSGSVDRAAVDARYDDDVISDGRLAFYGKAKLKGRYLFTAQADTTEKDLEHLFDGFGEAYPRDIFWRLDPDLYYPTYGDDSVTWRDVDTMGRFYLRLDWDKNQALWGNFDTGFTGTEYSQYVRALYGAALSWRSNGTNAWGDPSTEVRAFGSEAQTAPGHSEFLGTGGSLYYLRHTDILPGSEQVVLEIRDTTTGRVEERVVLVRGADYELDEMQGRILLTRPLAQITRQNVPTLTRDAPLDGLEQRLLVDYEWLPSDFDADEITAGLRGKQWFGDHLGVGFTYVDENRAGEDYTLAAGDVTLQAGKGTYLKLEYAQTESLSAPVFFSDNGGLDFVQSNPVGPREGAARSVEARANLKELGWTEEDWALAAWWREVGDGYSISRYDPGEDVTEFGAEALGWFTPNLKFYSRYSEAERGADALVQAQAMLEWRVSDDGTFSAELRRVEEDRGGVEGTGLLGAVKYNHRFGSSLELYGLAQATLDDDGGAYEDNDAFAVGGQYLFGDLSSVGGEVSTGDRGDAAILTAEYRLRPDWSLYGNYAWASNTTRYDSLFSPNRNNGWTLGQRWRLSQQANLFNESQYLKDPTGAEGFAHTFGMDFYPGLGWNLGFTLQDGELTNLDGGNVDRQAVSVNGGLTSARTDWQSKLEYRRDRGAEDRDQWVSTNRLTHRVSESFRIAARLNYADTDDNIDPSADARFIEGNVGFAWRPWDTTRWELFGRYTYLYDLSSLGQVVEEDYDQKTQVVALEGVYRFNPNWEVAGKLAHRSGEVRFGRGSGPWFDSSTNFAAAQLRYEVVYAWHAMAEYRWLDVEDGGMRRGWLLGLDRDIGKNFRIGVGYNFTDFSDDLTEFDYDQRGWFLNLVGYY